MLLLALDPGGTTGIAFKLHENYHVFTEQDPFEVYKIVAGNAWDYVVLEQFVTTNIHSNKYGVATTEIVGGVEAICWLFKREFVRRAPQQRIPFKHKATQMLHAMKRNIVTHERDALAHLLSWEDKLNRDRSSSTSPRVHASDGPSSTGTPDDPKVENADDASRVDP